MAIKMILALAAAFAASAGFGKWYVPWLKKRGVKQPLKDAVAGIYAGKEKTGSRDDGGA